MEDALTYDPILYIGVSFGIIMVLLLMQIALWVKLRKLRKKYVQVINGGSVENLEQLLADYNERLERMEAQFGRQNTRVADIETALTRMKSKVGVYRYNAFGERGSDLSFSLAIVSEEKDGVVLTGIHNRDNTFLYAKPLEKGQSAYALTPEEKEAINRSLGN